MMQVRGATLYLAKVPRRLVQRITVDALLLEDLIEDLSVCGLQQPLLPAISVSALSVVRGHLMVPVDYHGEQVFEATGDHSPESALRDAFLILFK
jgi:hypothetical protein